MNSVKSIITNCKDSYFFTNDCQIAISGVKKARGVSLDPLIKPAMILFINFLPFFYPERNMCKGKT